MRSRSSHTMESRWAGQGEDQMTEGRMSAAMIDHYWYGLNNHPMDLFCSCQYRPSPRSTRLLGCPPLLGPTQTGVNAPMNPMPPSNPRLSTLCATKTSTPPHCSTLCAAFPGRNHPSVSRRSQRRPPPAGAFQPQCRHRKPQGARVTLLLWSL